MDWSQDQLTNAQTIIDVGNELGASQRDIRIALMTAITESGLNNLSGGDLDSVGLFQQRSDWGSYENRHDPAQAARRFFKGGDAGELGLFDYPDRVHMTLGEAAQKVQVSAYPDRYATHQSEASQLLHTLPVAPAGDEGAGGGKVRADVDAVQPISDAQLVDSWHAPRGDHLHEGIDIMAAEGTPVHAMVSGTVVTGFDDSLGGTVVRIQGNDGKYYYYAHLSHVASGLQVGDRVETGEVIGAVGNTGDAEGGPMHLHLGIYVDGAAEDPYPLLAEPHLPDVEDVSTATGTANAIGSHSRDDGPDDDPFGLAAGHSIASKDSDNDGVTDEFERLLGTRVDRADSDGDGRSDFQETMIDHTNPLDPDDGGGSVVAASAGGHGPARIPLAALRAGFGGGGTVDHDGDGLSDLSEVRDLHTNPYDADSDGDGVDDGVEHRLGSNPNDIDTDHDGVTDVHEYAAGTLGPATDLSDSGDIGH